MFCALKRIPKSKRTNTAHRAFEAMQQSCDCFRITLLQHAATELFNLLREHLKYLTLQIRVIKRH